jgi:hypothetical protein
MTGKPSKNLDWNPTESNVTEPIAGLKAAGYVGDDLPLASNHNWIFNLTDKWLQWLQACNEFDAVIGALGTHASFAALFADSNIANLKNILIIDKLTSTQTIPSAYKGKRYTFKRGAGIDPTTGTGLIIQSEDNEILGYVAYSGSLGLQLTSTAKNNLVMNYRCMTAVTTEYQDDDTTETNSIIGMVRGTV